MHNFYPHKIQSSVTAQLIFRQLVTTSVSTRIYLPPYCATSIMRTLLLQTSARLQCDQSVSPVGIHDINI